MFIFWILLVFISLSAFGYYVYKDGWTDGFDESDSHWASRTHISKEKKPFLLQFSGNEGVALPPVSSLPLVGTWEVDGQPEMNVAYYVQHTDNSFGWVMSVGGQITNVTEPDEWYLLPPGEALLAEILAGANDAEEMGQSNGAGA